jgi:hypothetical protein
MTGPNAPPTAAVHTLRLFFRMALAPQLVTGKAAEPLPLSRAVAQAKVAGLELSESLAASFGFDDVADFLNGESWATLRALRRSCGSGWGGPELDRGEGEAPPLTRVSSNVPCCACCAVLWLQARCRTWWWPPSPARARQAR